MNNVVSENQRGIRAAFNSVVRGNTVSDNTLEGIDGDVNNMIEGNTIASNGGKGIQATSSLVKDNQIANNGGVGLELNSDSGYRENVIRGNTGGAVTGGVDLGGNLCNGLTTC